MWSFIKSYLFGINSSEDFTLENASFLLENSISSIPPVEQDTNINLPQNVLLTKTGIVTDILDNKFVIDNNYVCDKTIMPRKLELGAKISYEMLISDGTEKILKPYIINDEWDITTNNSEIWSNRVIICKVDRREQRKLYLTPGEIELDLDNVSLEFLPIIGDWLELDVKCTIAESSVNLFGNVIEINKVIPVRPHILAGTISCWNINEENGVINRNIFYNKTSLSPGYTPVVGDKVVIQVIESEQNWCCWRAIQVIPEYMKTKSQNPFIDDVNSLNYPNEYPGIDINGLNLNFDKLNITKYFAITVFNNLERDIVLKNVKILNCNSQCNIIESADGVLILRQSCYKINCQSVSKNIGISKDFILFNFNDFKIGKWIIVNVSLNINLLNQNGTYNYGAKSKLKNVFSNNNKLIKGEGSKTRFQAVRMPSYDISKKLLTFICHYDYHKDLPVILEELKTIKPVLFANLSYTNYEDKFHTLLHLDEIANLIAVKNYDQDKVCFILNDEFLMLEIENLSERRPSIVIGDKIIATDPLNERGLSYEGFVHKVGAKHVYLKFSSLFHDQYNGEDYSISVVPGRQNYRKLHHGVYLAVRNLGGEILFPSRLITKDLQLKFNYEVSNASVQNNQTDTCDEIKIDWYNNKLNLSQQNAVVNVLRGRARPLPYIIFGPPGTGKTVTLVEIILQITRCLPQSRLLITAPSNSAADLLTLRLIDSGVLKPGDLVRLISYNYAMSESIPVRLVPYCATGSNAKDGTTNSEYTENGITLEYTRTAIGRHRITVATCSTAGQLFVMGFPKGHFSHIIVDEAAQAAEPEVMIPILFLDKTMGQVILAGDPMQLGPVVLCQIAAQCGMSESYLERLMNRFPYVKDIEGFPETHGYNPKLVTKLIYSYRALPDILKLYSDLFYSNELVPVIDDELSKEAELLKDLKEMLPEASSDKIPRVIFHGVNGENYQGEESPSWFNPHEAAQIFYYINEFYRLGISNKQIGIITPYIKQVKEMRSLLMEAEFDLPKIGTVEEFQGQEFDVILISTVRSCSEYVSWDVRHSLGFVSNPKRLNVAVSRAKSLLIIVGNPNLLGHDVHWRAVIKYCRENTCYTGCETYF